jgi:hypothetical protein
MFVAKGELIAFRSILPDSVIYQESPIKFGWCSGVWVKPEYRGQKLSNLLLMEVLKDWSERLMFTNYAVSSERNNLLTNRFRLFQERKGARFYFYPNFNRICAGRKNYDKIKFFLPVLSSAIAAMSFFRSLIYNLSEKKTNYIELDYPDHACKQYINQFPDTFFNRKMQEINWIIHYPWVTTSFHDDLVYPFSYSKINYTLKIVKMWDKNMFAGFFIYTIINSRMKIPYYFTGKDRLHLISGIVNHLAKKEKIEYLTLLDKRLVSLFKKKNHCLAFSKSYTSNIYSSFELPLENPPFIFDGDGDNCFT